MRRTFTIIATALLGFGLVSCSTSDDVAEQLSPSTVTVTASPTSEDAEQPAEPPAEQSSPSDSAAPKAPPETPPPDCGISPSNSAITDPIDTLAPPSAPHTAWSYEGESSYDPCSDLSYALLVQQPQGNSQFVTQLLFFHQGEYIGIDSTFPQQVMNIEDKGTRLIVTYKDWEALEEAGGSNAEAPNYTATVTFFWDAHNGQLGTIGEFPNQNL